MISRKTKDANASRKLVGASKVRPTVIRASITALLCMGFATTACDPFTIMDEQDPQLLETYYSGCHTVYEGPICELPKSTADKEEKLTFWVAGHDIPSVTFNSDQGQEALTPEFIKTEDGLRFEVTVPEQPGTFTVEVASPTARSWNLDVQSFELRHPVLAQATQLRREKKHKDVKAMLEENLEQFSLRDKGEALSLLGRSELSLKNHHVAISRLEEAGQIHREAGNLGATLRDATTYTYIAIHRIGMQFEQASKHVNPMAGLLPKHYDSQHYYRWSQSLIAEKSSNHRQALLYAQSGMLLALRMGHQRNSDYLSHIYSRTLMNLHQFALAVDVLESRVRRNSSKAVTCEKAEHLNSLGWAQLLHRLDLQTDSDTMGLDTPVLPDPTPHFEQALKISQNSEICHPDKKEDTNSLLNLALTNLAKNKLEDAQSYLSQAMDNGQTTPYYEMWFEQTQAEIFLAKNQPAKSIRHFSRLKELTEHSPHPYIYWRGLVGEASARMQLGQTEYAQTLWKQAQNHVEQESLQAPIHSGRESFLAHRQQATQSYVESLLDSGNLTEALTTVQHARSQLLKNLEWSSRIANLNAQQEVLWQTTMTRYKQNRAELQEAKKELWQVSQDKLAETNRSIKDLEKQVAQNLDSALALINLGDTKNPALQTSYKPASNEIVLTYFKLENDWVAFLTTEDQISYKKLGALPPSNDLDQLSKILIEPFADVIMKTEKTYFQPWGRLRNIDFQRMPIQSKPLINFTQVVYSLGIGVTENRKSPTQHKAFIVSDPSGNLPLARQEAETVKTILEKNPENQVQLVNHQSAKVDAVKQAMDTADLFHYAGHGQFRQKNIHESALLLANDTQLNVGDILVLPKAPQYVILSACESAKSNNAFPLEGLGLAQAFALAGSDLVIASIRPVKDELSQYITQQLYQSYEINRDLSASLQHAQIQASKHYPDADWSTFRLITPQ